MDMVSEHSNPFPSYLGAMLRGGVFSPELSRTISMVDSNVLPLIPFLLWESFFQSLCQIIANDLQFSFWLNSQVLVSPPHAFVRDFWVVSCVIFVRNTNVCWSNKNGLNGLIKTKMMVEFSCSILQHICMSDDLIPTSSGWKICSIMINWFKSSFWNYSLVYI